SASPVCASSSATSTRCARGPTQSSVCVLNVLQDGRPLFWAKLHSHCRWWTPAHCPPQTSSGTGSLRRVGSTDRALSCGIATPPAFVSTQAKRALGTLHVHCAVTAVRLRSTPSSCLRGW